MKKKPRVLRFPKLKASAQSDDRSWHNDAGIEIYSYALSLQQAARTLVETSELENPRSQWADSPIIFLYRQALELHLKILVGEGCNFLKARTDPISLYQTHSLRWLAQIVCQIIRSVRWENEFKCGGISNLAEFSALVNELEALDPVSCAIRADKSGPPGKIPEPLRKSNVLKFVPRLDALIGLLEATADALAATWDQRGKSGEENFHAGDDITPTIH